MTGYCENVARILVITTFMSRDSTIRMEAAIRVRYHNLSGWILNDEVRRTECAFGSLIPALRLRYDAYPILAID